MMLVRGSSAGGMMSRRPKVNSADPDWCKTDMGGQEAPHTAAEGAETAVWLATLDASGPTGGFFNKQQTVPW